MEWKTWLSHCYNTVTANHANVLWSVVQSAEFRRLLLVHTHSCVKGPVTTYTSAAVAAHGAFVDGGLLSCEETFLADCLEMEMFQMLRMCILCRVTELHDERSTLQEARVLGCD